MATETAGSTYSRRECKTNGIEEIPDEIGCGNTIGNLVRVSNNSAAAVPGIVMLANGPCPERRPQGIDRSALQRSVNSVSSQAKYRRQRSVWP
ncbi:hypothetical protein TNIN_9161 [Trichonephila inaurata madagascariensis]|uniref:Uncharacterized protein n=1 Tax=Trichonephila inaurata madagascariensis TaxID=2747483 RepID=A0A8X6M758_9ARAC|nr:hypothetical protein TNIN_9161 [Trichonephila inaurata madagascariensis]